MKPCTHSFLTLTKLDDATVNANLKAINSSATLPGKPCNHVQAMTLFAREALINSTNVMKGEAHGTQQPRHINLIGEGVSTAQRSNSLVQSINQRFPSYYFRISPAIRPLHAC